MKKHKKIFLVGLLVLALAATSLTAFAYSVSSPADIVANLTGKSAQEVAEERYESGLTYGQIAYDEGLWEEFRDDMLQSHKEFLDQKVAEGAITQEEADDIYENIQLRQEACLGNGTGGGRGMMGLGYGRGFGGRGCGGYGGSNWQ